MDVNGFFSAHSPNEKNAWWVELGVGGAETSRVGNNDSDCEGQWKRRDVLVAIFC